ncbi:hypothetical protein GGF32_001940 [Allomyces javanicus]|nr:hypothetical protein GGF32_001940 [Allomyces javanicus]
MSVYRGWTASSGIDSSADDAFGLDLPPATTLREAYAPGASPGIQHFFPSSSTYAARSSPPRPNPISTSVPTRRYVPGLDLAPSPASATPTATLPTPTLALPSTTSRLTVFAPVPLAIDRVSAFLMQHGRVVAIEPTTDAGTTLVVTFATSSDAAAAARAAPTFVLDGVPVGVMLDEERPATASSALGTPVVVETATAASPTALFKDAPLPRGGSALALLFGGPSQAPAHADMEAEEVPVYQAAPAFLQPQQNGGGGWWWSRLLDW